MASVQPIKQHNMQLNDDFAAYFSQRLTFNPELQAAIPREAPQPDSSPAAASQPIVYSISQHYNHSAHIAKRQSQSSAPIQEEPQRRSSEPAQTEAVSPELILRNHGIEPSNLTPSQLQLFRIAEDSQKLRLLELWSICPPTNGGDIPALAWSSTTLEQEEHLAHARYERQQQNQTMSLDGTPVQTGSGAWHASTDTEPYVTSGYEELMRRDQDRQQRQQRPKDVVYNHFGTSAYSPATDPIYMGPDYVRQQQQMAMASQYGAFEQSRGNGDMDVMDIM